MIIKRLIITLLAISVFSYTYAQTACDSVSTFFFSDTVIPGSLYVHFYVPVDDSVALEFNWDFGDGTQQTETRNWTDHAYATAGTYAVNLTVAVPTVCTKLFTDTLTVTDTFSIPNVFSPNGDGINDYWQLNSNGITEYDLEIFDPSGILIYQTEGPVILWDGRTSSGHPVSRGVYYYVLKPKDATNPDQEQMGFMYLFK